MNCSKRCLLVLLLLSMEGISNAQSILAQRAVISPSSDTTFVAEQFSVLNGCLIDTSQLTGPYLTIVLYNISAECLPLLIHQFPDADLAQFSLDTLDNSYMQAIMNLDAQLKRVEVICQRATFSRIDRMRLSHLTSIEVFAQSGFRHKQLSRRVIKRIARKRNGFAGALNDWAYFAH